jgi:hypothetical protein
LFVSRGGNIISEQEKKDVVPLIKSLLEGALGAEDIVVEALRDMVKDEVKAHIRTALDKDPDLRDEIKKAIYMYLEARARQLYAAMKIAKGATKLGLSIIPPDLKKEMSKEILSTLEKELGDIMDRAL